MENAKSCSPPSAGSRAVCGRISAMAKAKGLTGVELSRRSGVSLRSVHSIMHGDASLRITTLERIAAALNVGLEALTGGPGVVREEAGAEYHTGRALTLSAGWMERFAACVRGRSALIEGAVNEYRMPFSDALQPAVSAFEKEETKA